MALTSCTCCRTRGRATGRTRPQAQRSCPAPAAASATYFCNHFTSRRRAYFRLTRQFSQFAPKPCIFSHTTPVRSRSLSRSALSLTRAAVVAGARRVPLPRLRAGPAAEKTSRGARFSFCIARCDCSLVWCLLSLTAVQYSIPRSPVPAKLIQAPHTATHPLRVVAKEPVRRPTHEFQPSRTAQSTDSKATGTDVAAAPTERALPRQTKPPWPMGTAGAWPWIAYSSMERSGASPLPRSSWRASSSGVRPLASLAPARAPGSVHVDTLGLCVQAGPRPRRRVGRGWPARP